MKLGLLSDLHANAPAFDACLEHLCLQGTDRLAILGDLVGYGPHPAKVVAQCQALQRAGALVLRGNHDTPPIQGMVPDPASAQGLTAAWTHAQLDHEAQHWLLGLATHLTIGPAFLVHATADAPEQWRYADQAMTAAASLQATCGSGQGPIRYVIGGHVHEQRLFYESRQGRLMPHEPRPGAIIPVGLHRRWLATIGSVGQPRDGDLRAACALLDTDRQELQFFRVEYDVGQTLLDMAALGLPDRLIQQLATGR